MITYNNRVQIWPTVKSFVELMTDLNPALQSIYHSLPKPDLCITDYELVVPRLAEMHHCPCISIDNQHGFLVPSDKLPPYLKTYCFLAGQFTKWLIPNTELNLITTFHDCNVEYKNFHHVGIIVRQELLDLMPNPRNFNLVYAKECLEKKITETLKQIPQENFTVYIDGPNPKSKNDQNLTFKKRNNKEFAQDLLDCKKVICAAGNQLIGEAKYFGKPVFAIPLPNQDEQALNAYFVKIDKLGDSCKIKKLTPELIKNFLNTQYNIPHTPNALHTIIKLLEPYLNKTCNSENS